MVKFIFRTNQIANRKVKCVHLSTFARVIFTINFEWRSHASDYNVHHGLKEKTFVSFVKPSIFNMAKRVRIIDMKMKT